MSTNSYCSFCLIDAAPSARARLHSAVLNSGTRLRRRGPRSELALIRRSVPKHRRALPSMSPGESGDTMLVNDSSVPHQSHNISDLQCTTRINSEILSRDSIQIYNINIRCLLSNQAELEYHLDQHRPHIVTLQETWLDASTEDVDIKGYVVVSRRDRRQTDKLTCGDKCGGVLTLRRDDFNCLVHIQNSESEERSWHFLRVQLETILLINWYRSPSVIHDNFEQLYTEMSSFFHDATGVIMIGDLNIHHKKWLRFSNADTTMGTELKTFCDFHGFLPDCTSAYPKRRLTRLSYH